MRKEFKELAGVREAFLQAVASCYLSTFRISKTVSVLHSLHMLWMISSPLPNPLLVCFVAIFILYICIYVHSYSNPLGCMAQYLPFLKSVFPHLFPCMLHVQTFVSNFRSHCLAVDCMHSAQMLEAP